MRRAFQRCSASVPRALVAPSSNLFANRTLRLGRLARQSQQTTNAIRSVHQSARLRQSAVAEEIEESEDNAPITRFDELGSRNIIHDNIVRTLTQEMGLETMTDVQSRTINEAIKGSDMIAQARTGTGKTLAFLLPVLQNIINVDPDLAKAQFGRRGPRTTADDIRAIIVSPTRELAEQIAFEAKKLVKGTGVIVQTAVGGTQKSMGLRAIQREGCHILVGTPGRLKDILTDPYSKVEAPDLSALVFDEADRLLDQGFWPAIQEIMQLLPTPAEKNRQTMMFSATVPKEVVSLVRSTLKPGFQFVKCVDDNEVPTHTRVPQHLVTCNGFENALPALVELCTKEIEASEKPDARPFKAIVYFGSTAEVALATSLLRNLQNPGAPEAGRRQNHPWPTTRVIDIHAKLAQGARTRSAENFKNCTSGILLSSDVTARGMDFPNVTHVIQMGLPTSKEQYVHRLGRTARAGKEGTGYLIINKFENKEAGYRLSNLPLHPDNTLATPSIDLTREAQVPASAGRVLSMCQAAVKTVPALEKIKVYKAQLGVFNWFGRKDVLVQAMNDLARVGWGMSQPPAIGPKIAQRLGLGRVPGLVIGHNPEEDSEFEARGGRDGGRGGRDGGRGGGRGGFGGPPGMGGRESRFGGRSGGGGGFGGSRGGLDGGSRGGFGGSRYGDRDGGSRGGYGDRDGGSRGGYGDRDGGSRGGYGGRGGSRSVVDPFE